MEKDQPINQIEVFRARRHVFLGIICFAVIAILSLLIPRGPIVLPSSAIILIAIYIWRYNMIYIKIGNDFIAIRPPAPIRGTTTILFDEIESISIEKKKIAITYINAANNKASQAKIMFNLMEDEEQTKLIVSIYTKLDAKILK